MAEANSISSLADAFREQRYLTYAEEELSPARDNFGRWFGTPYGYVADPDWGLPDDLFGRTAEVASSAAGNGKKKEEEAEEQEEPHWVITENEETASRPTYESAETAEERKWQRIDRYNDIIRRNNLPVHISSGYREPGQAGNLGSRSLHSQKDEHGPLAIDVTWNSGVTADDARVAMANCDEFVKALEDDGMYVLEEITPEDRKKYSATGENIHFGKKKTGATEEPGSYFSKYKTVTGNSATARRGGRLERGLDYMRILREYGQ